LATLSLGEQDRARGGSNDMVKENVAGADIQILHSQIAALEQLIEVYENSVVEQADLLYGEIAERRRTEEEIKALLLQNKMIFESAGEGIYGLDLEGKTIFANPASAKMIGYEPEELIGKLQHAILHHTRPDGTSYPKEECPIYAAFKTGMTHHVDNEVFWKKDGTSFPVEYTSTPMWNEGKLIGAVVVFKDITDRRQAEKEIRRLNEELEQKVEERTRELMEAQEELLRREKLSMLGIVAANVGNELRNPLGVMSNAVFFLDSQLTDAEESVKEYLEIIRQEIDGSQRILSDFIDFFCAKPPKVKAVPVDELIHRSLAGCVVPENVAFCVELPERLPVVKVDPSQMRQVFQNLITNAVQAMPEGGALRVSVRRVGAIDASSLQNSQQETGNFIEICVADSGAGISPKNKDKIFQPLFSTKSRGIGLGLSISRDLTEANGGRIEVTSEFGKGTIFSVILPVGSDKA